VLAGARADEAPTHIPTWHLRIQSDIVMMTMFGDGKERSPQEFEALLRAAGWKLETRYALRGMDWILQAVPCQLE